MILRYWELEIQRVFLPQVLVALLGEFSIEQHFIYIYRLLCHIHIISISPVPQHRQTPPPLDLVSFEVVLLVTESVCWESIYIIICHNNYIQTSKWKLFAVSYSCIYIVIPFLQKSNTHALLFVFQNGSWNRASYRFKAWKHIV